MAQTVTAASPRAMIAGTEAAAEIDDGTRQEIPASFVRLPVQYPHGFADALGYSGDRRFVGFCLRGAGRRLVAYDGGAVTVGPCDAHTFASIVGPVARRHEADLGVRTGAATHLFVWDRQSDTAYFAPANESLAFLNAMAAAARA